MQELSKSELSKVKGGGLNFGIGFAITAGVAFLIGVIDGIVRPLKCN